MPSIEPVLPGAGWIAAAGAGAASEEDGDAPVEDELPALDVLLLDGPDAAAVEGVSPPPEEGEGVDSREDVSADSAGF